jgi:hypothetical protein
MLMQGRNSQRLSDLSLYVAQNHTQAIVITGVRNEEARNS